MKQLSKVSFRWITSFLVISMMITLFSSCGLITTNDGYHEILGYRLVTVYSDSMQPVFGEGDTVILKSYDGSDLEIGEIISFWGFVDGQKVIITHRIVDVIVSSNGTRVYQTEGDNNALGDQDPANAFRQPYIYPDDIIGVYVTHI